MSWEGLDLGRYHLQKRIGRGGFGEVYRATEVGLDRLVAVKILSGPEDLNDNARKKLLERFGQEARIIAHLDHYNILPIFAFDQFEGTPYLVMPLMAKSLSQRLRAGPLSLEEIVFYCGQAAAGLQYAHDQNIIHRDIKPPNILLNEDERRLVIADFGIARILSSLNEMTMTSVIIGSPLYMAPEQSAGLVGRKGDIYSLGLTVYEMLTGLLPKEHAYKNLIPPSRIRPEIPPTMDIVVLKALEKDPDLRYERVDMFVWELERALLSIGRRPQPPAKAAPRLQATDQTEAILPNVPKANTPSNPTTPGPTIPPGSVTPLAQPQPRLAQPIPPRPQSQTVTPPPTPSGHSTEPRILPPSQKLKDGPSGPTLVILSMILLVILLGVALVVLMSIS